MHALPLKLFTWPARPAALDCNGLALIFCNLPDATHRSDARLFARRVLRELCAQLLNTTYLFETPRGPACLTGKISLSYADNKVLIGLSCHDALGVDIVAINHTPEIEMLSRLYLPASARVSGTPGEDQDSQFAQAWAEMEACCKARGMPLEEMNQARQQAFAACKFIDCEQSAGYKIAVAIIPSHSKELLS